MAEIVRDDEIRSGDPISTERGVTVLDVIRWVINTDEDSHIVAGEYGLSMADLFRALAYY